MKDKNETLVWKIKKRLIGGDCQENYGTRELITKSIKNKQGK